MVERLVPPWWAGVPLAVRPATKTHHPPGHNDMDLHECYSGRYWKMGASFGVILPPDVRRWFQLTPGELMLMAVDREQNVLVMRPARVRMIYDKDRGLHVPGPGVQVPKDA